MDADEDADYNLDLLFNSLILLPAHPASLRII